MRILDTSAITTTIKMPVKAGTLNHIQLAYEECFIDTIRAIIGDNYSATIPYRLHGLINTAGTVSAGAIFYQGEIFQVSSFSLPSPANANLDTTYYTAVEADPVEFTDGTPRNVHQIRKVTFVSGTPTNPFTPSFVFGDLKDVDYVPYVNTNSTPSPTIRFDKPSRYYRSFTVTGETALTITLDGTGAKDGVESIFVFQSDGAAVTFTNTTSGFTGAVMGSGGSAASVVVTVGSTAFFVFKFKAYIAPGLINKVSLQVLENT